MVVFTQTSRETLTRFIFYYRSDYTPTNGTVVYLLSIGMREPLVSYSEKLSKSRAKERQIPSIVLNAASHPLTIRLLVLISPMVHQIASVGWWTVFLPFASLANGCGQTSRFCC